MDAELARFIRAGAVHEALALWTEVVKQAAAQGYPPETFTVFYKAAVQIRAAWVVAHNTVPPPRD